MLYQIRNLILKRERANGYELRVTNLAIPQSGRLALTGPSGCGKSTTLDILGLGLAPTSAEVFTFSPDLSAPFPIAALWRQRKTDAIASLRCSFLGYVLQSGELLPFLKAGENMTLTARMAGIPAPEADATAHDLASALDIGHLWDAMPATLSVGERQRAAIVRALAARPKIIIADEPTAALDPLHAEKVMETFLSCVENFGSALILATHNAAWAKAGGLTELPIRLRETEAGVMAIVEYQAEEKP